MRARVPSPRLTAQSGEQPQCLRILHVDDDAVSRLVMQHLLAELGHMAVAAASADEALARAGEEPFDLILSDLHMPQMDGVAFQQHLAQTTGTPVVAVTADVITRTSAELQALGFAGAVAKPVIVDGLKQVLSAAAAPASERVFSAFGFAKSR